MSAWTRVDSNTTQVGWTSRLSGDELAMWLSAGICAMRQVGHGGIAKTVDILDLCRAWPPDDRLPLLRKVAAKSEGHWILQGETFTVTNWRKYNPDFTGAERQARYRDAHPRPVTPVTVVTPTVQDVTKEDKQDAPGTVPPELAQLPLYAADKKLCSRFSLLMAAWRTACPGVNILGEIAKAHAWEVGNPGKVKKDRARFLTNWLNRAQDAPRSNKPPPGSEAAQHTAQSERFRDSDKRADALKKKVEDDKMNAAPPEELAAALAKVHAKLGMVSE